MKCQLYITRLHGADDGKIVRIEARDGPKLLSRIEIDVEGFALAVMGQGCLPAEHTTVRQYGPRASSSSAPSNGEKA